MTNGKAEENITPALMPELQEAATKQTPVIFAGEIGQMTSIDIHQTEDDEHLQQQQLLDLEQGSSMTNKKKRKRRRKQPTVFRRMLNYFKTVLVISFFVCALGLVGLSAIPNSPVLKYLLLIFKWIESFDKVYGALIFTAIYSVSVMLMVPATPFNLASGFMFDIWLGALVAVISVITGAQGAFFISRFTMRKSMSSYFKKTKQFVILDKAVEHDAFKLILLTRLSPVFPFPFLNYFFGVTNVPVWKYFLATAIGVTPFTVVYTYFGSALRDLTEVISNFYDGGVEKIIMIVATVIITLVVVIFVMIITQRALKKATKDYEREINKKKDEEEKDATKEQVADQSPPEPKNTPSEVAAVATKAKTDETLTIVASSGSPKVYYTHSP